MNLTGRILIIDDEPTLRNTLTRILRQGGCDVTGSADGEDALRRLEGEAFDLVFLDIRMPNMDGLQVLRQIRNRQPKLPVILLTAYGSLQTALQALRLGAADYLLKPIDPEVLLARARMLLKEQAIQRRRQEIQDQIKALEAELRELDSAFGDPVSPSADLAGLEAGVAATQDRFLKRGRLILDLQARRASFGENVLSLPPASFDYLVVLARRAPAVVDYQTLVNEAQGYHTAPAEARQLAKWHIHVLRQALEPSPQDPGQIITVRGSGYRLIIS